MCFHGGDDDWSGVVKDVVATALAYLVCKSLIDVLRMMQIKGYFDVHLYRKLVHIIVGIIPMFFWPMYRGRGRGRGSSIEISGRILASLVPILCMVIPLLLRTPEEEELIKSFGRYRSPGDLVKALAGYLFTYIFTTLYFSTTPIAISTICNLCAGDGAADILGRRFGKRLKLPYNKNKSFAGSIGMAVAGFSASILVMSYLWWWGMVESEVIMSRKTVFGFMLTSVASAAVESHPWSDALDDNLTAPLTSIFIASLLF